jgi:hypothetical protein
VTGDDEHFDLNDFKLEPESETVGTRVVGVPKRIKKRSQHFVMIPRSWVDIITANTKDKTLAVVCHLLYETWRQRGGTIKVSNGMLGLDGVGRGAKWRVLNMLEKTGLVSIDRRDKKSPIVTVNIDAEAAVTKGRSPPPEGGGRK